MSCEATVGGETVRVSERVLGVVYADPVAREHIEQAIRTKLMFAIADRWKPKIRVRG